MHVFSERYQQRKAALLDEVAVREARGELRAADSQPQARGRFAGRRPRWRMALAAAVVCALVVIPLGSYAAVSHGDLFDRIFGNGAREDVTADSASFTPAREYAEVDVEQAEALLSGAVADEVLIFQHAGVTVSVQAAVRSAHAMVMTYTIEKPQAVDVLAWNPSTNSGKGAAFAEHTPLTWTLKAGESIVDSMTYVDPSRSVETHLTCYAYALFGDEVPEGAELALEVRWVDEGSIREALDQGDHFIHEENVNHERFALAVPEVVGSRTLVSVPEVTAEVSPLAVALHLEALGLAGMVPQSVVIEFANGESYVVQDAAANIDNAMLSYAYGESDATMAYAFNRLVDPAEVASIEAILSDGAALRFIGE